MKSSDTYVKQKDLETDRTLKEWKEPITYKNSFSSTEKQVSKQMKLNSKSKPNAFIQPEPPKMDKNLKLDDDDMDLLLCTEDAVEVNIPSIIKSPMASKSIKKVMDSANINTVQASEQVNENPINPVEDFQILADQPSIEDLDQELEPIVLKSGIANQPYRSLSIQSVNTCSSGGGRKLATENEVEVREKLNNLKLDDAKSPKVENLDWRGLIDDALVAQDEEIDFKPPVAYHEDTISAHSLNSAEKLEPSEKKIKDVLSASDGLTDLGESPQRGELGTGTVPRGNQKIQKRQMSGYDVGVDVEIGVKQHRYDPHEPHSA